MAEEEQPAGEPSVAYTVRELLKQMSAEFQLLLGQTRDEMRDNFRRIFEALDTKVNRSEFANLQTQVQSLAGKVQALESHRDSEQRHVHWRTEFRRWLFPAVMSTVMTAVMVLSYFFPPGGRHG